MSINILSPSQLKREIAKQAKQRRLEINMSRKTLALRSKVPASTIKRFETSGDLSLDALLRIALVLDCLDQFTELFIARTPISLYKMPVIRKRGRE